MHPDDAEWDAWTPQDAARRLAGVRAPWAVAAGWAIDLFLGRERRDHEDLEIAVPTDHFDEIAAALGELEPHLSVERRRLLAEWIDRVHPGHFWPPDLA